MDAPQVSGSPPSLPPTNAPTPEQGYFPPPPPHQQPQYAGPPSGYGQFPAPPPPPQPVRATRFGKLAWSATIIGIVGVVGSIIPFLNNVTAMAAVVGLILGIVALFGTRKKLAIVGTILCVLAMVFTVIAQKAFVKAIDKAFDDTPTGAYQTDPASQPSGTAKAAKPAARTAAKVGQAVKDGYVSFVVEKVKCGVGKMSEGGPYGSDASPQHGQFCVMVVKETNISNKPQMVPTDVSMVDRNGNTYNANDNLMALSVAQSVYLGANFQVQMEINPGTQNKDVFLFDVPATVKPKSVVLHGDFGTDGATVNVQ
jgi:hypothetical protein